MADDKMPEELSCSFCGKKPIDIELLMGSCDDRAHICNECLFTGMVMLYQSENIDFDTLVNKARNHPMLETSDPD